ncbi:hypothetical protein SBV1_1330037 [Verrucomicrobia bacterium]|nr:hypothetical protein SBV1_1330037 [Verrucomicrobiota bacterium]
MNQGKSRLQQRVGGAWPDPDRGRSYSFAPHSAVKAVFRAPQGETIRAIRAIRAQFLLSGATIKANQSESG